LHFLEAEPEEMPMKKTAASIIAPFILAVITLGCGAQSDMESTPGVPTNNMKQPVIEEPDLYRWADKHLYVQNPQTGLNILDVSDPARPKRVGRAGVMGGAGAEMYIHNELATILLKTATPHCMSPKNLNPKGWKFGAEVAFVDVAQKTHPKILQRYCIAGELVASRTVDRMLYVVSKGAGGSRAISIDTTNPQHARVVQQQDFFGSSKEIIVTADAIFVASRVPDAEETGVQYVSINAKGEMKVRGLIQVPGDPQGRFHMSREGKLFRIVTYRSSVRKSRLSIIDVSTPDHLKLVGELPNIGKGEKLYATRFDGDMAYVVTFKRTDPLWVISLKDPTQPKIVGELHVPGWSDFLFPMGKRLVAVGRGNNGMRVGVSLFDVSDPTNPRSLHQISLGSYDATSEANVDHRAVTILEPPGGNPVVVVPHTSVSYDDNCSVRDHLQLVEVQPKRLQTRGSMTQQGAIRRTLLVDSHLYSISDYEVLAMDMHDLDHLVVDTAVTIGTSVTHDQDYNQYCRYYGDREGDDSYGGFMMFCSAGGGLSMPPVSMVMLGVLFVGLRLRRRVRR